jgi:hypothetical protein
MCAANRRTRRSAKSGQGADRAEQPASASGSAEARDEDLDGGQRERGKERKKGKGKQTRMVVEQGRAPLRYAVEQSRERPRPSNAWKQVRLYEQCDLKWGACVDRRRALTHAGRSQWVLYLATQVESAWKRKEDIGWLTLQKSLVTRERGMGTYILFLWLVGHV